jgi:hypothetical protein
LTQGEDAKKYLRATPLPVDIFEMYIRLNYKFAVHPPNWNAECLACGWTRKGVGISVLTDHVAERCTLSLVPVSLLRDTKDHMRMLKRIL